MKWTYDKIRRYAECQRRRARREGCNACGKMVPALELAGTPPLSRMTRDGYGIERVKEAIRSRGWFCRGCVRDLTKKEADEKLLELHATWVKKKKQQQCPGAKERATEEIVIVCFALETLEAQQGLARELCEGEQLEEVLEILKV